MTTVTRFTASWCQPCKASAPVFQEFVDRHWGEFELQEFDIDEEPGAELAKRFNVRTVPTTLFYSDGDETARFVGITRLSQLEAAL